MGSPDGFWPAARAGAAMWRWQGIPEVNTPQIKHLFRAPFMRLLLAAFLERSERFCRYVCGSVQDGDPQSHMPGPLTASLVRSTMLVQ